MKNYLIMLGSVLLMLVTCITLQYRSVTLGQVGTAWFINNTGYLVTANHVVTGVEVLDVKYNGTFYPAYVVARDKQHDIAILKTFILGATPVQLSSNYTSRMEVLVLGYPQPMYFGYKLNISSGTATFSLFNSYVYIHANTCPGNSGSPVIGHDGMSVGLVNVGYTAYQYDRKTRCSSEGGGTSSKYIIDLARRYGININVNTKTYWYSFRFLFKRYENSVVFVYGE